MRVIKVNLKETNLLESQLEKVRIVSKNTKRKSNEKLQSKLKQSEELVDGLENRISELEELE